MSDEAVSDHRPLARDNGEDSLGDSRLEGELSQADRRERRDLGGLQHDRASRGQCGCESPACDRHGEVPGDDDAHDADGLVEGHVDAAGHGDLAAEEALRSAGVVGQHVADVARLPARIADGVAGVGDLELGKLLDVVLDYQTEAAE